MNLRERSPVAVGGIGLAVLLAFGIGTWWVTSNRIFEDAYPLTAMFEESGGLKTGSEVRLAGVKAGRVTALAPDFENGHVRVELDIFDGVDLGPKTTAAIKPLTLVGEMFVELDGPLEEPYLASLAEGERVIPVERTFASFGLPEILDTTSDRLVDIDADALGKMFDRISDVVEDKGPEVGTLVRNVDRIATAVNRRDDELAQLLRRLDRFTGTLAEKDEELQRLITASDRVLAVVSARRDELALALGEGNELVAELSATIRETRTELDRILDNLHTVSDVIAREQDDIDRGLSWLGTAFDYQSRFGYNIRTGEDVPWTEVITKTIPPQFIEVLAERFPDFEAFLEEQRR